MHRSLCLFGSRLQWRQLQSAQVCLPTQVHANGADRASGSHRVYGVNMFTYRKPSRDRATAPARLGGDLHGARTSSDRTRAAIHKTTRATPWVQWHLRPSSGGMAMLSSMAHPERIVAAGAVRPSGTVHARASGSISQACYGATARSVRWPLGCPWDPPRVEFQLLPLRCWPGSSCAARCAIRGRAARRCRRVLSGCVRLAWRRCCTGGCRPCGPPRRGARRSLGWTVPAR
jgi:hypothetical protein